MINRLSICQVLGLYNDDLGDYVGFNAYLEEIAIKDKEISELKLALSEAADDIEILYVDTDKVKNGFLSSRANLYRKLTKETDK